MPLADQPDNLAATGLQDATERTEHGRDVAAADSTAIKPSRPRGGSRNNAGGSRWLAFRVPTPVKALLIAAGSIAFALGVYTFFDVARTHARDDRRFLVAMRDIEITPPPVWVRCDLVADVQELADFPDTLHTLDPNLSEALRDAFGMHPWVGDVAEVRVMHPSTIRVKLTYREPVAVVHTSRTLEAVDREGVLLPATELPDPHMYLTVTGVRSTTTGPAGTKWDDPALAAAVALADAVSPHHRALGLTTIDVGGYRPTGPGQGSIYLLTEHGTRVRWGRPPIVDYPGEVPVQDKLDRLNKYIAEHGSLDRPDGPYDIDISHWNEITIRPRSQAPPRSR